MLSRERLRIENARLYSSAIVDQLRAALSNCAELHADESRKNFYDLYTGDRTYFIYISPVSGTVTLIATWVRKRPSPNAKPMSVNFACPPARVPATNRDDFLLPDLP